MKWFSQPPRRLTANETARHEHHALGGESLLAALLAAALAAGVGALAQDAAGGAASEPASRPAVRQIRGISLQLHVGDDQQAYDALVDEIAKTGANTVCLTVTGLQDNAGSAHIATKPSRTPADARLASLIDHAHKQGLQVVLMPLVLLENARSGEWRGKINPTKDGHSWDDWWKDYDAFILHYAQVAQEAGVEMFMVGSELISVESQTEHWTSLIAQVRQGYHGLLSYSANWDHYKAVGYWDKLDAVGLTSYYELSKKPNPTVDELVEAWKPIKQQILAWQAKVNRPVLFTELGWPNQKTAAEFAWDYYRSPKDPDPALQRACFEAFFRTWADEKALAGYVIWEWRTSLGQKTDANSDTSYCPKDKPAMEIIGQYFRSPMPE